MIRVGFLAAGAGIYRRRSNFAAHEKEASELLSRWPVSLQQGFKRRMMECVGRVWEDSLRPTVDPPTVGGVGGAGSGVSPPACGR